MNQLVKEKLDKLIALFQEVSSEYKWEGSLTNHFTALTYTLNNREFDKEKIKDVRKYINQNTGIFSNYRGTSNIILSTLLSSKYESPKQEFDKILDYDKKMRKAGYKNNMYLPIASYALLTSCSGEGLDTRINKALEIYSETKKNHPWLTGGDDYPLSILLANSEDTVKNTIENMDECYKLLNENGFHKSNGLQFLSHILQFRKEENKVTVLRCKEIFDKLKDNNLKVYTGGYAMIGFLSLLGDKGYDAVDQVIEVVSILKSTKKYKWLTKETHLYTAAALVSDVFIENIKNQKDLIQTTIGISIETLIAAQTVAIIAAASSTAAMASTSSS
ncbi:DUF4003 family protein [Clostridium estertheticum]|uniref:DUF4003 family protein n=1 Tax=Clostridium estertheticum TaxID=238834 RepID=UPI001C0C0E13|nr:DUF4003 family protein [Clostridium estertheticum]MBU3183259.1 DUF4003 domain-containing protein [Clostridium estertheticum]